MPGPIGAEGPAESSRREPMQPKAAKGRRRTQTRTNLARLATASRSSYRVTVSLPAPQSIIQSHLNIKRKPWAGYGPPRAAALERTVRPADQPLSGSDVASDAATPTTAGLPHYVLNSLHLATQRRGCNRISVQVAWLPIDYSSTRPSGGV